jgi:hypothetical protein
VKGDVIRPGVQNGAVVLVTATLRRR